MYIVEGMGLDERNWRLWCKWAHAEIQESCGDWENDVVLCLFVRVQRGHVRQVLFASSADVA